VPADIAVGFEKTEVKKGYSRKEFPAKMEHKDRKNKETKK